MAENTSRNCAGVIYYNFHQEAILNDPTAPYWLPACDGSYQDCVTENGDVCVAGSTEHECEDGVDWNEDSLQSTTTDPATTDPDPNQFSPTGGGVYFPTESVPNPDRLNIGPFGIPLPNCPEFRN